MTTVVAAHIGAARRLRRTLSGAVHLPGERGYDVHRRPCLLYTSDAADEL